MIVPSMSTTASAITLSRAQHQKNPRPIVASSSSAQPPKQSSKRKAETKKLTSRAAKKRNVTTTTGAGEEGEDEDEDEDEGEDEDEDLDDEDENDPMVQLTGQMDYWKVEFPEKYSVLTVLITRLRLQTYKDMFLKAQVHLIKDLWLVAADKYRTDEKQPSNTPLVQSE